MYVRAAGESHSERDGVSRSLNVLFKICKIIIYVYLQNVIIRIHTREPFIFKFYCRSPLFFFFFFSSLHPPPYRYTAPCNTKETILNLDILIIIK